MQITPPTYFVHFESNFIEYTTDPDATSKNQTFIFRGWRARGDLNPGPLRQIIALTLQLYPGILRGFGAAISRYLPLYPT